MEGIDFLFIAIGLVCVIVSFFLSEKMSDRKGESEKRVTEWKEKLLAEIRQPDTLGAIREEVQRDLSERMKEKTEEQLYAAGDELGRITNEKMLAFGEYSNQVMEKIHQNHTEVVFLYDMLKEKESVLKDLAARVEGARVQVQSLLSQAQTEGERLEDRLHTLSNRERVTAGGQTEPKRKREAISGNSRKSSSASAGRRNSGRKSNGASAGRKAFTAGAQEEDTVRQQNNSPGEAGNERNEQILRMHREGRSIMEISKLLGLGQGEVKLVIDLFHNVQ